MAIGAPQHRYEQHRPERTVLYQLVSGHLETFLEHVRRTHESPLPKYLEAELRAYLECGIRWTHCSSWRGCRHSSPNQEARRTPVTRVGHPSPFDDPAPEDCLCDPPAPAEWDTGPPSNGEEPPPDG